jgi:AraC-like DNA-binding protein
MRERQRDRLPEHTRFRGTSADALVAFLARKGIGLDLQRRTRAAPPFRALINAVYLDGIYVSYIHYSTAVQLHASPPRPDYGLSLPIDRGFRINLDGHLFDCNRDATVIASPSSAQSMELGEGCRRIGVSFGRDEVVRQLSALLGEPIGREPIFEPEINLCSEPGRRLRRVVHFVVDELESMPVPEHCLRWRHELEQLAITTLLLTVRHDWSDRLDGEVSRAAPTDVKRTIDYLQANIDRPITLAELATVSGVSGSTLLRHFRRFTGDSPLGYLRTERLRRAREDLLRSEERASVTEVASRWGFTHLGRFAAEYRRRFGESPSDTRPRARRGATRF